MPESNRPHGLLVHLTVVSAMIHNFRLESVATINWFIIFRTKRPHPESNRNPGRYPVHLPLMACSAYYTVMCYVIQRFFRIAFSSPSQLRPGSSPMFLCYTKCSAGQCFDFCAYAFLLIGFFFFNPFNAFMGGANVGSKPERILHYDSPCGWVRLTHLIIRRITVFRFSVPWRYRLSHNHPPGCDTLAGTP